MGYKIHPADHNLLYNYSYNWSHNRSYELFYNVCEMTHVKSCVSVAAFKMRLGSVSTVGGDRQLVPLARSRILRWAGGGAERAEGIGGAMAHNALWLQEGGTCACPGLDSNVDTNKDRGLEEEQTVKGQLKGGGKEGNGAQGGWYLALAQAEEGRLVLTRLVRWSRGDKELKKFIRTLLKQPCPEP